MKEKITTNTHEAKEFFLKINSELKFKSNKSFLLDHIGATVVT